jgi:hypothetical protein
LERENHSLSGNFFGGAMRDKSPNSSPTFGLGRINRATLQEIPEKPSKRAYLLRAACDAKPP